jgi:LysM repeat protein
MKGSHARPSQTGKLAGQAAKFAPAVAVAGTMLGMPHHQPQPPRIIPAEHVEPAELTASVRPAAPDRVYVVQAGDSLWSIAQRFYGNPHLWSDIYYANQSQIHDPNLIYPGQNLTLPHAGPTNAASAARVRAGSSAVPASSGSGAVQASASPMGYIRQAAHATGMPVSVVKAQNYVESSYGQNMGPSSAGAMGPWQFEPYTWPSYSTAPFSEATNWAVSTQAYIAMMKQLLHWSGGNIRTALAAYNAGQGNWQAGLGYADQILSLAGQG